MLPERLGCANRGVQGGAWERTPQLREEAVGEIAQEGYREVPAPDQHLMDSHRDE